MLAYRSGDPDKAIEYAKEAEKHNPQQDAHAFILAVIALAKLANKDQEGAEQAIQELSPIVDSQNLLMEKILLKETKEKANLLKVNR